MKLIVGLGNPGARYEETRHNIGFAVVEELARRHGVAFRSAAGPAMIGRARLDSGDVLLARPTTFMNLSGHAVAGLAQYYRVALPDILVVVDDVNLPLGRLRARARGSTGGHNGLKSVAEQLGTEAFARLRVGVGRGDDRRDLADHVLARFDRDEQAAIDAAVGRAADAAEIFASDGIERVMNAFNRQDDTGGEDDAGPEGDL